MGGFLHYRFGGGGLIFGGAYFRNLTVFCKLESHVLRQEILA